MVKEGLGAAKEEQRGALVIPAEGDGDEEEEDLEKEEERGDFGAKGEVDDNEELVLEDIILLSE